MTRTLGTLVDLYGKILERILLVNFENIRWEIVEIVQEVKYLVGKCPVGNCQGEKLSRGKLSPHRQVGNFLGEKLSCEKLSWWENVGWEIVRVGNCPGGKFSGEKMSGGKMSGGKLSG